MINIIDACKKLARIELSDGSIVKVFPNLAYNGIPIVEYNIADGINGIAIDKEGNEHRISDCCCFSLDGKRINLDEVKGIGNNFYELINGDDLKYFTNINGYGDGETWRLFNDYAKIESLSLDNITTLPAYTLFRCTNLESLNIPSGLTDIETYAIASCDGLTALTVSDNNPVYTSRDSNGNECNCIVEKPVVTMGRRSAINNQLTLIQGCNVTTLPDNIKHIASGAFDECTRLTSITLPDGLLTMGDNVFRGCTALSGTVVVPNTVESIGVSSFMDCTALNGVNINIPVISEQLFKGCSSLSNVTLGNNVTTIGNQAFMNDSSLTAITIPDSITVADTSAFMNCDLRSINTNNIETISANLFIDNVHLTSVTMTDNTVGIGDNAFNGASITEITIPQNIRSISNTAFRNCNNLQRVVWDSNDTNVGRYSTGLFINNASTIEHFEFGEHCTVIPNNLCRGLYQVYEIEIPSTITRIGSSAFEGCLSLTDINIPNNVEIIQDSAFYGCSTLETVTMGSGISEISEDCFRNCVSLETVDLSNNPNKIDLFDASTFQGCDNLSLIIVPDDLIAEYRESQDWYEYRELIFGKSIYTITFDSMSGETTPSTQNVRCGGYIENPGTVHKDLYEFEYWEDEDGYQWDFEEDYVIGDMTLYAHYREVKAIMVKSISNDVTNISMSYTGSYPANVEYSYDGLNWYNIWNNNNLTISLSEGYSDYVYFRGYNPNGFSRGSYPWGNNTKFNIISGQCDLLGNIIYLKDYNEELDYVNNYEFSNLFQNNNSIVNINKLLLHATTLAEGCYNSMFNGCTSLTTAPELPATTLAQYCYYYMFEGCSSLTTAPELPATTLAEGCYQYMFSGCSSLTTAPVLPATTLANSCYSSMFNGCSSLTTAPVLPATTLVNNCYYYMFYGCSSLTTAPELPATTLAEGCYSSMFRDCSSLTEAPELPATTLAEGCYSSMFRDCSSLTEAPELPATTLAYYCYSNMFYGCTNLSCVTVAFTDWTSGQQSGNYAMVNWLYNVSSTGTFHCPLALNIERGESRIPYNWDVVMTEHPTSDLYFESTGNTTIGLAQLSSCQKIWYTKDNINWDWSIMNTSTNINLADGERLYLIGLLSGDNSIWTNTRFRTSGNGTLSLNGNLNYLWDYRDLNAPLRQYCGYNLFNSCSNLTDASELTLGTSATTLAEYCYSYMFGGCVGLAIAPELPATTLAEYCYSYMFGGCSSLATAPELPATTLANRCYSGMFSSGCIGLATAPELPATTLAEGCYSYMFGGCSSLTTAPVLPATTLANSCYSGMFNYCSSLTTAPELPATTLTNNCYQSMFSGCVGLAIAPVLPATTLAEGCYSSMFRDCSSLATAPELPATMLASGCYRDMFGYCSGLVTAPELPATILAVYCYSGMFSGCVGLAIAPVLPATTLAEGCYSSMFYGCSSLTTAPELPATTLANGCYSGMFRGCTSLSSVTVAFTDWSSNQYPTSGWLEGVSINGDFYCQFGLLIERGGSRIPENWDVNAGENTNMLRFKSHGNDVSTIGLNRISNYQTIEYASESTNWQWIGLTTATTITMQPDEMVYVRGNLTNNNTSSTYTQFSINGNVSAHGNLNYLWNTNGNDNITLKQCCGYHLFYNCTGLTDASELTLGTSATTLAEYCYSNMFYNCTSLATAPVLPATMLASYCYRDMFDNCSSLTTAPELPATTLADYCYYYMFAGCTSLTTAPELPATTLATSCYDSMFEGCSSLTTAPELPATTLANECYYQMFRSCRSLTTAPELPATTLAYYCYSGMFYGCTSLSAVPQNILPATTLAEGCYSQMFSSCSSLNYIKCLATNISASSCTYNWVYGVAGSGVFIKNPDMQSWTTGTSGIPSNWTVEDAVME